MRTVRHTLDRPLKHMQLRAMLRSQIAAGTFKPGDQLLSENEMAAQYGVSRPTVREAVGALVQEGVLERFQGKGTFVAREVAETRDIAFVLCGRDYTDPLFAMTLKGAERRCQALGYRLVHTYCDKPADLKALEAWLLDHRPVRGLVVTGILDLRWLLRFMDIHENVVLVGDVLGRKRTPDVVLRIVANNGEAASEAMGYLLGLGHQRIAHITSDLNRVWFREPYETYVQSLKAHGIAVRKELVVECADEGLSYGHEAAQKLLRLRQPPTAIFCTNDRFAWGAINAIREAQLRVPDDISVMGMNDLPLGDRRDFLTTAALQQEEMGELAVERIIAGASGAYEQIIVPMKLKVRLSCAPHVQKQERPAPRMGYGRDKERTRSRSVK